MENENIHLDTAFEEFITEDVIRDDVGEVISVKDGMPLFLDYQCFALVRWFFRQY